MHNVLKSIAAIALFTMSSAIAHAELSWTASGPGGGGAFAGAAASRDGKSLVVPSDLGGAYLSFDSGTTWQAIGSANGLATTHVDAALFHPKKSGTIYLGGDNGIYRSTNCADKTSACQFRKMATPSTMLVTALATDVQATTIYAAGIDGWCNDGAHIWRSSDDGATWDEAAATGLPANANIMAIRVQEGNADTIIALSAHSRFTGCGAFPVDAPNRAFISTDGGATFTPLDIPTTAEALQQSDSISDGRWAYVEDAKFDVSDPRKLWVSLTANPAILDYWTINGEVWVGDGSAHFTQVSNQHTGQLWPLTTGHIRTIDLRRQYPWNKGETGVWDFYPATTTWTRITTDEDYLTWDRGWVGEVDQQGKPNAPGLANGLGMSLNGGLHTITPINDRTAWWTSAQFAFQTTDGGHIFRNEVSDIKDGLSRSRGIDNAVPLVLVPSGKALYAGYLDMGCWFTPDAGSAHPGWRDCNGPKSKGADYQPSDWNGDWKGFGGNTTAIAVDPSIEGTVWFVQSPTGAAQGESGGYKIAKSTDQGRTLTSLTHDLSETSGGHAITDLAVEAKGKSRNLFAITNKNLFALKDGATHWTHIQTPCDGGLMVMALSGATFLTGGGDGVCSSTDGGKSWTKWQAPWTPTDASTWWLAGEDIEGHTVTYQGITDFAFDPEDSHIAWMTVMLPNTQAEEPAAGLYKTIDSGVTWTHIDLPNPASPGLNFARTVAVDGATIVVGTSTALTSGGLTLPDSATGAWVSRDRGNTWSKHPENAGLAYPFITRLRFGKDRLWGVSPGQGVVFSAHP